MTTALKAACSYAKRGWRVVPIKPGGKHPAGLNDWQTLATVDQDVLREWWEGDFDTSYGVGIATGRESGVFVLDVDTSDGKRGDETLADLEAEHGHLPATVETITGSGGRHLYFRWPSGAEIRNSAGNVLGPGLDIRGEGGQVLAPPTVHPNGTPYEWEASSHPDDGVEPAEAPLWLLRLLTEAPRPSEARRERRERPGGNLTPGDRFNAETTWPDLLEADGASFVRSGCEKTTRERYELWSRPPMLGEHGFEPHPSASLYYKGSDVLKVFTSNWGGVDPATGEIWQLEAERTYDRFGYYAARHHGGDTSRAAAALRRVQDEADIAEIVANTSLIQSEASNREDFASSNVDIAIREVDTRTVTLTPASAITIRPVHWLWDKRVALGTLSLIGGREGIGKSTVAYTLAADITKGMLPGRYFGAPKAVIVAATEDSWEHTIVPRLMAARADLDRVFRVDVETPEGMLTSVSLPRDLIALERHVGEVDAAMILLDPLMSRLDAKLDTHKDAEVRLALEPLTAIADRTKAAVFGLIHVNKSISTDPLTTLMGSRAFAAVARSVLFVIVDPDNEGVRVLGQPKNNLGRIDLPSLTFTITGAHVADTEEGPVWTGKVVWTGETERSIAEVLRTSGRSEDERVAAADAAEWLESYLDIHKVVDSRDAKAEGKKYGHADRSLERAREQIGAGRQKIGKPTVAIWSAKGVSVEAARIAYRQALAVRK